MSRSRYCLLGASCSCGKRRAASRLSSRRSSGGHARGQREEKQPGVRGAQHAAKASAAQRSRLSCVLSHLCVSEAEDGRASRSRSAVKRGDASTDRSERAAPLGTSRVTRLVALLHRAHLCCGQPPRTHRWRCVLPSLRRMPPPPSALRGSALPAEGLDPRVTHHDAQRPTYASAQRSSVRL